jgi:single-stranded DNA-binding protein
MNSVSFFGTIDSEPQLLGMPGRDVYEFWLAVKGRRDKHALYVKVVAFMGLAVRLAAQSAGAGIHHGGSTCTR